MNVEETIRRGELAKRLIENPMFQEAFDTCEKKCHDAWAESPVDNPDLRDNAYLMLVAGKAFRDEIERIVQAGLDEMAIAKQREENDQWTK